MTYIYLAIAIVAEVVATSALKASSEFSKLLPSLVVVVGYGISFYLMAMVLRTMPIGITYAIWSGVGIVTRRAGSFGHDAYCFRCCCYSSFFRYSQPLDSIPNKLSFRQT